MDLVVSPSITLACPTMSSARAVSAARTEIARVSPKIRIILIFEMIFGPLEIGMSSIFRPKYSSFYGVGKFARFIQPPGNALLLHASRRAGAPKRGGYFRIKKTCLDRNFTPT